MDASRLTTGNILVVEDDPIMLKAITNILNKGGYQVFPARDAKEAFELLEQAVYDIVITDLMLPYANGLEVVRNIRKNADTKDTGIIVVSTMGHEEVVKEAYGLGADIFLKKPIMAAELLLRIQRLLIDKNIYSNGFKAKTHADIRTNSANTSMSVNAPDPEIYATTITGNGGNMLHIRRYTAEHES